VETAAPRQENRTHLLLQNPGKFGVSINYFVPDSNPKIFEKLTSTRILKWGEI
jgi:hypothetical protein